MTELRASLVPYSPAVGSSIVIRDDAGVKLCQLLVLNFEPKPEDEPPGWHKVMCEKHASEIIDRINGYSESELSDIGADMVEGNSPDIEARMKAAARNRRFVAEHGRAKHAAILAEIERRRANPR